MAFNSEVVQGLGVLLASVPVARLRAGLSSSLGQIVISLAAPVHDDVTAVLQRLRTRDDEGAHARAIRSTASAMEFQRSSLKGEVPISSTVLSNSNTRSMKSVYALMPRVPTEWAALIGVGDAIAGAIVGGVITFRTTERQVAANQEVAEAQPNARGRTEPRATLVRPASRHVPRVRPVPMEDSRGSSERHRGADPDGRHAGTRSAVGGRALGKREMAQTRIWGSDRMRRVLTEYTGALFEWTYGCEGIAEIGGVAISMTTPQYERAKASL